MILSCNIIFQGFITCQNLKNHDHESSVYKPSGPKGSGYYQCVENHFEELEGVWDDRYESRFGFWRPYIMDVIFKYLDCGDLHSGFAVMNAGMNIYWHSPASEDIFALPATKNGLSNTANGY